jgi:hypothetical protein
MKRKSSRYRTVPFSERTLRPIENRQPNFFRLPSSSKQPGVRARKIFVIKQVQRLPATTAARKKIQRILIFDDHPDSLRLVLEGGANPHRDLSLPQRVSSWELILVSILTMGALLGMFWPLF